MNRTELSIVGNDLTSHWLRKNIYKKSSNKDCSPRSNYSFSFLSKTLRVKVIVLVKMFCDDRFRGCNVGSNSEPTSVNWWLVTSSMAYALYSKPSINEIVLDWIYYKWHLQYFIDHMWENKSSFHYYFCNLQRPLLHFMLVKFKFTCVFKLSKIYHNNDTVFLCPLNLN